MNAAARVIFERRKCMHITSVLQDDLHWLTFRPDFKLFTLMYKALYRTAPLYLSELCIPNNRCERRSVLRSAADDKLMVPGHIKCSMSVERVFCIAGPAAWNNLPSGIRNKHTLESFKSALKTYYFTRLFLSWQYWFISLISRCRRFRLYFHVYYIRLHVRLYIGTCGSK